jgi:transposase
LRDSASLSHEIGAPGHDVRLMPLADVRACFKRTKNDAAGAEAICEPVTRPNDALRIDQVKAS